MTSTTEAAHTPRRHRSAGAAALIVISALALLAAACGNSSGTKAASTSSTAAPTGTGSGQYPAVNAPGVSATEIQVGGVASVSNNPLGSVYGDSFKGVQAYFNMVNAQGGIYGRKLVLSQKLDDQVGQNQAQVQQLLQDNVFSVLPVSVLLFSGAQTLVDQNMPTFGWAINGEWQGTAAEPRLNMFGESGSYLGISDPSPVLPWLAQ